MAERVLRMDEIADRLGISRATVHRWIEAGKLPPKRQLGSNIVGVVESELDAWIRGRPVVGAGTGGGGDEQSADE